MREYGKINTRFWADTKMLRLTVNARFMVVYLLTGPHTNSVGRTSQCGGMTGEGQHNIPNFGTYGTGQPTPRLADDFPCFR